MNRIFITGAPGSGTTLLRRLFFSFEDIYVYEDGQIYLSDFVKLNTRKNSIVGKRDARTIFSHILKQSEIDSDRRLIDQYKVKILNIIRDGRDVTIGSNGFTVPPERWIECMRQAIKYKNSITIQVKYEDIVKNPNVIQKKLSNALNIKPKYKFSDFPSFLPENLKKRGKGRMKVREIDGKSINKDSLKYREMCKDKKMIATFDRFLKRMSYV
jgi:hypothetical protein